MNTVKNKSVQSVLICGLMILAISVLPAEAKRKKMSLNLAKLQGTWVGYGKVKGQKSKCRITIRDRRITGLCANASGSVSSVGRVRGANKMWAKWQSRDGFYTGTLKFRSIRRKSHKMTIYVDGHGSGTFRMRKR